MKTLRVLIADDDAGMRLVLRRLLEGLDGFETVGEASDGLAAVESCRTLRPDVVFLDVEMPQLSGTEAARQIADLLPDAALIFVTAHSEYMPEAFEVYAFDYLLKPFKADRVRQTLRRLRTRLEQRQKSAPSPDAAILLHGREEMSFVPIREILFVSREGRTTNIVTADETYTTSEPLSVLWPKLEPRGFLHSHRAYIINPAMVAKIYPYGRWSYSIRFRGSDREALITRDKLNELEALLS